MDPNALREELAIDDAAKLIARTPGNTGDHHEWGRVLKGAVERDELPAHYREVESFVNALIAGDSTKPPLMENVLHVKCEDLQRFCVKYGIKLPYEELPSPPGAGKQDLLSRRLAWFEDYCRSLPDADLYTWQKKDFLPKLHREPLFAGLKKEQAWNKFWAPHAVDVLDRVREARRRQK